MQEEKKTVRRRLPFSEVVQRNQEHSTLSTASMRAKKRKGVKSELALSSVPKKKDGYDSFDEIPPRSPPYKYVRGPVRKRDERRKLRGQTCANCEKFYKSYAETHGQEAADRLLQKCSRHRDKYTPPKTPPGFWNPTFSSDDEEKRPRYPTPPGFTRWTSG